jgi:hypothetical protein
MQRKALLLGLAVVVALAALAVYPFSTDELSRLVLERVRERTGIPLVVSRSRFRLWEGLSFEGVSASVTTPLGRYDVELERILFEHRPLALLAGRVELGRVWLHRPRVVVTRGAPFEEGERERGGAAPRRSPRARGPGRREPEADDPDGEPAPQRSRGRVDFRTSGIRMTGGEFRVGERIFLSGVDVDLLRLDYDRRALSVLHALSSEGVIAVGEIAVGSLRLRGVSAGLVSENGRFDLNELSFSSGAGKFEGSFACDFNVIPLRYRTSFIADPIEIEGFGGAVLRLDAEGFGTEARHLKGEGLLELAPGALPGLPFLRSLSPVLPGAIHRGARAELRVEDGVIRVQGLRFETPSLSLDVEGEIDLDGTLDLELTLEDGESSRAYRLAGARQAPTLTRRD